MNLKAIRLSRGLSQKDLAEMAGVQQATVSKVENGYDGVTLRTLNALANALRVDVMDLISSDRASAEIALLQAFRNLSPERQQGWLDLAAALVQKQD